MSHDRGCHCGREKYEYDSCSDCHNACLLGEPVTLSSPPFPFLFEVPAQSLKDEALQATLHEAYEYVTRCEKALSDAREALKWADEQYTTAAERLNTLRNEYAKRNGD
jgi:hypothetical protein